MLISSRVDLGVDVHVEVRVDGDGDVNLAVGEQYRSLQAGTWVSI
jgi:hypothetical protein